MDYNDLKNGADSGYWYFAGKTDMLSRIMKKHTGEGMDILSISCGTGDDMDVLSRHGTVFATEYSKDAIGHIRQNTGAVRITRSDAQKLNFRDGSFDCVVMLDVLEHLEDDSGAMDEIGRVLKTGGTAIISVPAHMHMWSAHDEALGHKRRYSKKTLRDVINSAGLDIERMTYWNTALYVPVACMRMAKRAMNKERAEPDVKPMPGPVNRLLKGMICAENRCLEHLDSPAGISIFAIITKE